MLQTTNHIDSYKMSSDYHMIKTTMAEAMKERPRKIKTKPKKKEDKTKAGCINQPAPTECDSSITVSLSQDPQQDVLPQSTAVEVKLDDNVSLVSRDLETDGAEMMQDMNPANLSTVLQHGLVLQDEEKASAALSSTDHTPEHVCLADTGVLINTSDIRSCEDAATGAVPVADLLGLDESAISDTTQVTGDLVRHEQHPGQVLSKPQNAEFMSQAVSDQCLLLDQAARSVECGEAQGVEETTAASVENVEGIVQGLILPRHPEMQPVIATNVPHDLTADIPRHPEIQPVTVADIPHGFEADQSDMVSTVMQASAPLPSLESKHPESAPLPEQTGPVPTTLPDAAESRTLQEAVSPPSAPQAELSLDPALVSTEVKLPLEAASSSATHLPLYPKVPQIESPGEGRFQPMSIQELQQLYYNPQLQANPKFVDDFVLKEEKKVSHEFYDILMNYCRSRKNLLCVEEDLKQLNKSYEQSLAELWVIHKRNVTVEGQCADGSRVQKVHSYEQCELNGDALSLVASMLKSIQDLMQGDLALFAYSSQLSRLQVESYLHLLFTGCPHLRDMPRDAPVTAVDHTNEVLLPQIEKLKQCVSVLFSFHRKPMKDVEFVENLRKWTERLVASLLRVASYSDHLFVLNHILRCPAGVGKWASSFVQIPAPASLALQTTLGSPVLDHAVTCLATVLLPIKAREEFMCQMKISVTEQSLQMDQMWTLVDSDGEEDEDPAEAWLYLHENDVVSILQQFPMDAVFAHILQAPMDENGIVHYDVRRCTEPSMMKLFAFCTAWIFLLGAGLNTYSMARYRQLNKRLGRHIRQAIAFVSDHWLNFKTYYGPLASAAALDRLQMEFDQLFMRATYTILTAQKLGSWQFMADMPFTCLSADSVWRLLWLLQQGQGQPVDLHTLPPVEKCKEDLKDIESRRQLADALQNLPTSESIFLLTTFANMAAARPLEEHEFIECITLQVFEIAFICDHTRDLCSKTGRELLSSIIQKHPTALSMLLRRVQEVMGELGSMSLYLFSELPASIWIPQDPDMLLLRQWLLNNDLTMSENHLACVVLGRMNWDLFTETGKLVLDIRLHRQVALLLVEAYVKYISDRRASFFIIEGMKQMASYAYTSSQGSREQQFNNWAWSIALRLKLHREAAILHSRAAESHPFQAPLLEQEQWLLPLATAAKAKNPLACFLVLSMTDVGHHVTQFMKMGLEMLLTLAMSSQYSAVIHVLSCVTPQFLASPQYLLENETFHKILHLVLTADESVLKVTKMAMGAEFKAGTVTQQFTQMIQAMISARLDHSEALPMLLFWVQAIFKVARFLTDLNCCYVLDHLVRWGFLQKGAKEKLDGLFRQYHKQLLSESRTRTGLLTWMGGGASSGPSLMERSSMPEFSWLAAQVLSVEESSEQESGLWPAVQQELHANQSTSVETAMKHVLARLKLEHPRILARLSIYRWAQQALDTPISHPMLPIIWQKFFFLYLHRCQQEGMPSRASVGERFFQSLSMSSMRKKMKAKLKEAADFHLKYDPEADTDRKKKESPAWQPDPEPRRGSETISPLPSPLAEESPQYFSPKDFHNQLAKLYQTLALWIDESILHSADLCLQALPYDYRAEWLISFFTSGKNLWLEFVDFDGAQYDISLVAAEWRKLVSGRPQFGSHSPLYRRNTLLTGERSAKDRILQRLQRFSTPVAAPALQPVSPPVPDISSALLTDKMAAIHLLDSDLRTLAEFTKFFCSRVNQQCAINSTFLELIPGQFSNVARQARVTAECRSRVNPLHRCAGPAAISVRVEEREVNPVVQRKMDENRAEYKQLVIEAVLPPPQNICIAAVHVENAITLLIKLSQNTTDPDRRALLDDVACTLFFHLTVQVCENSNFYPPTKQFFASCVEILGQEFVSRSPGQTPLLLQFSLDNPSLAGMVGPHFVPNNAPQHFVSMYEQLITALQQQNLNLVFVLHTKFDVWAWLEECQPSVTDKKRFLEILGSALMSCGAEPTADTKVVFDLYLTHLRCVLRHQFPTNLSPVLSLLLQGSSSEELHTSCWEMLLMECCGPSIAPDVRGNALPFSAQQAQACNDLPLSTEQLEELLQYLGVYFNHQRKTQTDMSKFGLYPRWGRYVPYLSLLMGLLSRSFIAKVLVSLQDHNPFQAMQVVWHQQLDFWQAWLEPLPAAMVPHMASTVDMMQPWSESDSTVAVTMVEMFKSTLLFTHATLANIAPQFGSTVFSLLLMHYMTRLSHSSTPVHVSDVLVAEFSQLPWEQLKPDLQLMETMAQMKERLAGQCFVLIGHVMPKVAWPEVIAAFKAHQDPQVARRLQAAILLLLVQCHVDMAVRELPEMGQLLTWAETFDWAGLTAEAYRTASFWFLQMCQPQWALAQRSSLPALGFRLMKAAAEFTPTSGQVWTGEISIKRLTYVHCMTQQLCQVTYLPSADLEAVSTVLVNLLSEIESVESVVSDVRSQEEESLDLMKEVLSLLNNSNPEGASHDILLQTLQQWLHSSPQSILLTPCIKATSRCLASLVQMVQITETCIQVYFTAYTQDRENSRAISPVCGWDHILAVFQVPELNVDQYVEQAIHRGSYLLLYALLLHRRPLCQGLVDEAKLMDEVLNWTSCISPVAEDEAKLLLWWFEFCRMWLHQLDCGASTPLCINSAQKLVQLLHQLGEDRATTGFFGVIGFGKRSQLSLQFRLAVRSIAAFLASQILSETTLRFQPTSPLSDLPMAKQSRAALTSLRSNKMYAPLKEKVESMVGFIHRTDHTARSVLELIRELAVTLYPGCDYLTVSLN